MSAGSYYNQNFSSSFTIDPMIELAARPEFLIPDLGSHNNATSTSSSIPRGNKNTKNAARLFYYLKDRIITKNDQHHGADDSVVPEETRTTSKGI